MCLDDSFLAFPRHYTSALLDRLPQNTFFSRYSNVQFGASDSHGGGRNFGRSAASTGRMRVKLNKYCIRYLPTLLYYLASAVTSK